MTAAKGKYIAAVIIYGTIGMTLRYISFPSEVVVLCRGAVGSLVVLLYTLWRHTPPDRAAIVQEKIAENPDLQPQLQNLKERRNIIAANAKDLMVSRG